MNSRTKMLNIAILTLFGWLILSGPVLATGSDPWYWLAPAKVQATGQKECYGADQWNQLTVISCDNTGQDGEYQVGVKPLIARFKDNHNGTVRDLLTGLIWLKDAFCSEINPENLDGSYPGITWQQALDAANNLEDGHCGLTDKSQAGDWRLPNINELYSLISPVFHNWNLSNSKGDGPWVPGDPFNGLNPFGCYWSSTTNPGPDYHMVWYVTFTYIGEKIGQGASWVPFQNCGAMAVWPVRGGK